MSSFKDIEKLMEEQQKSKITCPCGHRIIKPKRKDRVLCSWCKKFVYKDKATEFRYKMKQEIIKGRKHETSK